MSAARTEPPPSLTQEQATHQRALDGPNELPRPPRRTAWRILLEVAREPMLQLLVAAVGLYLALGNTAEAGVLLVFVAMIVTITLVQERRTERVLEALHDMTSPRAVVWRDATRQRVAGTALVRGDIIELTEGDRVPADARLLAANDLAVDESLLTGESLPVAKAAEAGELAATVGLVRAGTMVVAGQALAQVTATGARSEIGRIGKVLGAIEAEATPLTRQTRQLVRWVSVSGLAVSLAVGVLYAWTLGDALGGALAGITLAMSMLPQEFLLILTVFMAMGAWRLSQRRVLTRRAATIETLGAATILCTDKTGTLTQNRMAIQALVRCDARGLQSWRAGDGKLPLVFHDLLREGVLASEPAPVDPMERSLHQLAQDRLDPAPGEWTLVHEYGLSPQWPVMSHVWQAPGDGTHAVAAKGAPESVTRLCRLSPQAAAQVLAEAAALAGQGMRVLAVARATWAGTAWPADQQGFEFELLGLVAFADPLREQVPQAIRDCQRAGIRVAMITGDHPATALAIARQAGIDVRGGVLLGDEIETLDDTALRKRVTQTAVFARVAPQQKLRIVQALKANGEVVAMTGDGVNDAPSLKSAHIGIAMGGRGTDVAREASSLVLLDDDFASLVQAVRLGRRIHDNLRKAMRFVFAVHLPIAGLATIPLVFGWPLLFSPMHIAFLEIVMNPVCSIAFEAQEEERDVMERPPRTPGASLFSPAAIAHSLIQGALVLAVVGLFYAAMQQVQVSAAAARTAAFIALVTANIALILVNRSFGPGWREMLGWRNQVLWRIVLATLALLAIVIAVPLLRQLLGFEVPGPRLLAVSLGVGAGALVPLLAHKRLASGAVEALRR